MANRRRQTTQAAMLQESWFYRHPEAESPLRSDVGTQPQFNKKKPLQESIFELVCDLAHDYASQRKASRHEYPAGIPWIP